MLLVGLLHFFWLRPPGLTGPALDLERAVGPMALYRLAHYLIAALLPAHPEVTHGHGRIWFAAAAVAGLAVVAAAHVSSRIPRVVWAASAAFVLLLGPALAVSFPSRAGSSRSASSG
jgi:hypothetical protein